MREILFRGQRTDTKEWDEGYFLKVISATNEKNDHFAIANKKGATYEVIPETVGQFTGLTDKNGTKIFEGDILRETFLVTNTVGDVRYIDGCMDFVFKRGGREMRDYLKCLTCNHCTEIIGNIHDNPELLGGDGS